MLVSMRVTDYPDNPATDSVIRLCHKCLSSVWVSASSPYWTTPVVVTCTHCVPKDDPDPDFGPLTDAQRLDIARHTGLYGDQIDWFLKNVIIPDIFGRPDQE